MPHATPIADVLRKLVRLAAGILLFGAASAGWAAGVAITLPAHGTELLTTSAFYDPVDQTVQVRGAITGITPVTLGDYEVLINGFGASVGGGGGAGTANFGANVAIGPMPPPGMAGWPSWVPYVNQFSNIEAINLPILAELYHVPTQQVVGRYRVVMVDKRWDDDMNMHASGGLTEGGAFELTELGIDALEPAHASSLPQPGLVDFNADLTDEFAGTLRALETDTDFGSSTKACVGVEAEPMLTATDAYTSALFEADIQYELYQAAEDACENGNITEIVNLIPGWGQFASGLVRALSCVAKNSSCVRELPRNDRFEVCAGQVEGIGQDLAIAGVQSADLMLAEHASIEAMNLLGRVDGDIDVTLKDLFIRWDVEHTGCTVRPKVDMTETDRLSVSAVAAWSSCPAVQADADWAVTLDSQAYTVTQDGDPEALNVTAGLAPNPLFELSPNHLTNLGSGTCDEDFVSADVETLLEEFYDPMRDALDATWDAENPHTQQAEGLDLLLSRFETGMFGDMSDVILDLEIKDIESGDDRLRGKYDSDARLRPDETALGAPEFVHSPRSDFPCEGGAFPWGNACRDSRNFYGDEFDASYSVTTGMLNQVIGQRYPTNQMFRLLTPTCDDLGLPSGCGPDDQPVLDGTNLASLHSSLAGLGATQVAIELTPTMVPFTWIHPDPPTATASGRGDVTYQLGQYQVDFIGDTAGPDGTTLWLSVIVDFFAPGLELDIARAEDTNEIVADLGESVVWHYTIVKSQLAGCPLIPRTNLPAGYVPPACEGELTSAVGGLAEPVLANALHAMVSQHPAPQMFDAAGEASDEKVFDQTDKFQWGQVITFYGDLVD